MLIEDDCAFMTFVEFDHLPFFREPDSEEPYRYNGPWGWELRWRWVVDKETQRQLTTYVPIYIIGPFDLVKTA